MQSPLCSCDMAAVHHPRHHLRCRKGLPAAVSPGGATSRLAWPLSPGRMFPPWKLCSPNGMGAGTLALRKGSARGYPGLGATSLQLPHWEPQSPPAADSATLHCTPVPGTPSVPQDCPHARTVPLPPPAARPGPPHARAVLTALWGPQGRAPRQQCSMALAAECVSVSGTQDPVWVCLEDNGG